MYRILVVDDEPIEREGIKFLLSEQESPFQVITKNNGEEALEFLKSSPVDLLCTDIKMPFMDGMQLCEAAKKLYPQLIIILLTAFGEFEYAQQAIKFDVAAYLLKPVSPGEFSEVMRQSVSMLESRTKVREDKIQMIHRYKMANFEMKEALLASIIKDMEKEVESDERSASTGDAGIIRIACDIINREYATNLSLAEVASRVHLSKGYLSALFKEKMSMSVMQYITMLRMQKAQKLLLQTSMKIGDVAAASGYSDVSYFGMIFKKLCGMTPAQFRNGDGHE